MAKTVEVSPDNGSTWYVLPGGTGEFVNEGESIEDTIFGHTFRSGLTGLIGWGINGNAIYKNFAGYLAKILQQGTATTFTAEAMTLVSGKTYRINDTTKEIWDRSEATMDILDTAVSVAASNIKNIDYLFGQVTFVDSYTPSGAITATGKYFPTTQLGKGRTFTLTLQADAIDDTDFATAQANGGYRTFTPGLRTVALELGGIFDATVNSKSDLAARNELIIEIDPAGDGLSIARGFFRMITTGQSGDVGALEEETLNLTLNVPDEVTNPAVAIPFGWDHAANTTLSDAIKTILDAWSAETIIDARYLPQGATGQSPLDGVSGDVVVTDVSLTGGLSDMNTFVANLQGSGAYTEV